MKLETRMYNILREVDIFLEKYLEGFEDEEALILEEGVAQLLVEYEERDTNMLYGIVERIQRPARTHFAYYKAEMLLPDQAVTVSAVDGKDADKAVRRMVDFVRKGGITDAISIYDDVEDTTTIIERDA